MQCIRIGDTETEICALNRYDCLYDAKLKLFEMENAKQSQEAKRFRKSCNCLPACESIKYEAEYTRLKLSDYILEQDEFYSSIS